MSEGGSSSRLSTPPVDSLYISESEAPRRRLTVTNCNSDATGELTKLCLVGAGVTRLNKIFVKDDAKRLASKLVDLVAKNCETSADRLVLAALYAEKTNVKDPCGKATDASQDEIDVLTRTREQVMTAESIYKLIQEMTEQKKTAKLIANIRGLTSNMFTKAYPSLIQAIIGAATVDEGRKIWTNADEEDRRSSKNVMTSIIGKAKAEVRKRQPNFKGTTLEWLKAYNTIQEENAAQARRLKADKEKRVAEEAAKKKALKEEAQKKRKLEKQALEARKRARKEEEAAEKKAKKAEEAARKAEEAAQKKQAAKDADLAAKRKQIFILRSADGKSEEMKFLYDKLEAELEACVEQNDEIPKIMSQMEELAKSKDANRTALDWIRLFTPSTAPRKKQGQRKPLNPAAVGKQGGKKGKVITVTELIKTLIPASGGGLQARSAETDQTTKGAGDGIAAQKKAAEAAEKRKGEVRAEPQETTPSKTTSTGNKENSEAEKARQARLAAAQLRQAAQEKNTKGKELTLEKASQEQAAQKKAALEQAAQKKAALEQAAQKKAALEQAEQAKAALAQAAREKAALEQAEQAKAALAQAAQEKAALKKEAAQNVEKRKADQDLSRQGASPSSQPEKKAKTTTPEVVVVETSDDDDGAAGDGKEVEIVGSPQPLREQLREESERDFAGIIGDIQGWL